jgi:hypothetical protein
MTVEYFNKLPNGYIIASSKNKNHLYSKINNNFIKVEYKIIDGKLIKFDKYLNISFERYSDILIENERTNLFKVNRIWRLKKIQEKISVIE